MVDADSRNIVNYFHKLIDVYRGTPIIEIFIPVYQADIFLHVIVYSWVKTMYTNRINSSGALYIASGRAIPRIQIDPKELYLQLRTPCTNISILLLEAEKIADLPEFDINKKVVIFMSGWITDIDESYHIQDMAKAYHCRGDYNFMYVNTSTYVRTLYDWSAINTDAIGVLVAGALVNLTKKVPVENIRLVGHSLGAQIAGKAGREFTNFTGGQLLPHITGLDPANPCFNEGQQLMGIRRGDAVFIDIVHSNPGVLGVKDPAGDVDFYPGGDVPIKPGCNSFGCSHSRSYQYYIESIYPGHERDFLAKRCGSVGNLDNGVCNGPEYPMGYAVPFNLKGVYFLGVNDKEPFGKNATSTVEPSKCGLCNAQ